MIKPLIDSINKVDVLEPVIIKNRVNVILETGSIKIEAAELEAVNEGWYGESSGTLQMFPLDKGSYLLKLDIRTAGQNDQGILYNISFLPSFFEQFPVGVIMANRPFRFDETTEMDFPVCQDISNMLLRLHTDLEEYELGDILFKTHVAIELLGKVLKCMVEPFNVCQSAACKFLEGGAEAEKIHKACQLINNNTGKPFTIPELARKVAMNECYLKKGFKAVTRKTVHEYQHDIRMHRAKAMLIGGGHNVTEVAAELGYNSISHFSTAFRKYTGIKPCELLS